MCEDGCGVGFVFLHGLVTRWHGLYNLVANGNAQMGNGYDNVFIYNNKFNMHPTLCNRFED